MDWTDPHAPNVKGRKEQPADEVLTLIARAALTLQRVDASLQRVTAPDFYKLELFCVLPGPDVQVLFRPTKRRLEPFPWWMRPPITLTPARFISRRLVFSGTAVRTLHNTLLLNKWLCIRTKQGYYCPLPLQTSTFRWIEPLHLVLKRRSFWKHTSLCIYITRSRYLFGINNERQKPQQLVDKQLREKSSRTETLYCTVTSLQQPLK